MTLALLTLLAAGSGDSVAADIDAFVKAEMERQHIPGLSLLVVKNNKVIRHAAYGFSDAKSKVPSRITDRYDIGSIGKPMTATLTMKRVEQFKLSTSDRVSKFIPDWPKDWRGIEIRHLLTHQAGIPDYAFFPGIGLNDTFEQKKWNDIIFAQKLEFPSGTVYQYSNSNYTVLGMILEAIDKRSYKETVERELWRPLNMRDTSFREPGKGLPAGTAKGYYFEDGKLVDAGPGGISPIPSDGGAISTVADLRKFATGASKIVSNRTLEAMRSPAKVQGGHRVGYGLGWMTRYMDNDWVVSHGGNSTGYSGTIFTVPERKLEIYMLCNLYPVGGDDFGYRLAGVIDPELRPRKLAKADDPDPAVASQVEKALIAIARNALDDPAVAPMMRYRMLTPRGQMVQPGFAEFADGCQLQFLEHRAWDPDRVFRYRCTTSKSRSIIEATIDREGRICTITRSPDPGLPN